MQRDKAEHVATGVIWVLNAIINCKRGGQETGSISLQSARRAGQPNGMGSRAPETLK